MERTAAMLPANFDEPLWIGLYARDTDDGYAICRIVFGAELKDREVYAYLLRCWRELLFSPA